jgi:hypothetical protein
MSPADVPARSELEEPPARQRETLVTRAPSCASDATCHTVPRPDPGGLTMARSVPSPPPQYTTIAAAASAMELTRDSTPPVAAGTAVLKTGARLPLAPAGGTLKTTSSPEVVPSARKGPDIAPQV